MTRPYLAALNLQALAAALTLTAGVAGLALLPVVAKPISYDLPEETATLKPGPNVEVAQGNCMGCHSVDYIITQPRGPQFKKDFWQAEVTKMIKVYGAPIDESDASKIIDYLAATY
jgi:sulfite dehydrogenase (cytochrome) subunit B